MGISPGHVEVVWSKPIRHSIGKDNDTEIDSDELDPIRMCQLSKAPLISIGTYLGFSGLFCSRSVRPGPLARQLSSLARLQSLPL